MIVLLEELKILIKFSLCYFAVIYTVSEIQTFQTYGPRLVPRGSDN